MLPQFRGSISHRGLLPLAPALLTKLAPSPAIWRPTRKNAGIAGTEGSLEGSGHAAEPSTTGRIACRLARARRGEVCRRLVFRALRRHPRAGDRDPGGPLAALAQGPGARLGHGRIRHA